MNHDLLRRASLTRERGWQRGRWLVGNLGQMHASGRVLLPASGCRWVNGWGCAQAIVRPGEEGRRLKQCLVTPGTHGIFQC